MEISLTKEAEYLLCSLYSAYRARLKTMSNELAPIFGPPEVIQSELCNDWSESEIIDAAFELSSFGLVLLSFGDDSFDTLILKSAAISMMEHRYGDKLDKLLSRIAALRSFLLP